MYLSLPSLLILLPALTLSSPTTASPRQLLPTGQTVKQDVINIHNAVLSLDATVQSYDGSPFPTSLVEGTPVLLGVAEIHRVNRAGFVHALAASPFNVQDSVDVVDTVVTTVNKSIPAATQDLKAKKPAFQEGNLTTVVIASLALLLNDHDTFSAAVLAKVNTGIGAEKTKEGQDAVKNIHDAIQDAIAYYAAN